MVFLCVIAFVLTLVVTFLKKEKKANLEDYEYAICAKVLLAISLIILLIYSLLSETI